MCFHSLSSNLDSLFPLLIVVATTFKSAFEECINSADPDTKKPTEEDDSDKEEDSEDEEDKENKMTPKKDKEVEGKEVKDKRDKDTEKVEQLTEQFEKKVEI